MNKTLDVLSATLAACLICSGLTIITLSKSMATPIKSSEKSPKKVPVFEERNYRFELQRCQRKKEAVNCTILATNLSNSERNLLLYGNHNYGDVPRAQIIDPSGNEYLIQNVYVGQSSADRYEVVAPMPSNIPKRINVTLKLPQQTNKLAVFEVTYRDGKVVDTIGAPNRYGKVQFRNVNIVPIKG